MPNVVSSIEKQNAYVRSLVNNLFTFTGDLEYSRLIRLHTYVWLVSVCCQYTSFKLWFKVPLLSIFQIIKFLES